MANYIWKKYNVLEAYNSVFVRTGAAAMSNEDSRGYTGYSFKNGGVVFNGVISTFSKVPLLYSSLLNQEVGPTSNPDGSGFKRYYQFSKNPSNPGNVADVSTYDVVVTYSRGSYIGEVTAEETAFTDNTRHSDGFWYVKDRPANVAPTISGSDEDLGAKINPFTKTFFVDDLDLSQSLTVVVKLNNSIIRTIDNASRKENYTVDINQERFDGLTIDVRNTIEISVTDTSGATAVRRWYFTRINTNPTVTVAMSNLGEQNAPFSFKFTADDADGDDIKAKIFIDDVQIADLGMVTRGQEQTYKLGKFDYSKIKNGTHKIKIEVTDSKNARGYGFVDFSKNITFARYKFTKEVTAQASTIIVNLMAEIAQGATVTIKVCNNAYDTNPTWETVPEELHGQAYNFQNTTKTASQWGVGVEVRIDRATATKDSYFYGFVGAFN